MDRTPRTLLRGIQGEPTTTKVDNGKGEELKSVIKGFINVNSVRCEGHDLLLKNAVFSGFDPHIEDQVFSLGRYACDNKGPPIFAPLTPAIPPAQQPAQKKIIPKAVPVTKPKRDYKRTITYVDCGYTWMETTLLLLNVVLSIGLFFFIIGMAMVIFITEEQKALRTV